MYIKKSSTLQEYVVLEFEKMMLEVEGGGEGRLSWS